MKVSYNWLKEYIDFDWAPGELAERLTKLGLEVEGIDEIIPESEKIVAGKILEVKEHPQSSKLHICLTDVGDRKISVVCGAPNVKENLLVVAALPEAELPAGITVEETRIRGEVSEGMLCSEKELGISDDHSGILILDSSYQPGEMFKYADEFRDVVIDCSVFPNRPDWLSMVGIAREIGALTGNKLKVPSFNIEETKEKIEDFIDIDIQDTVNCPRYTTRLIRDITIGPSPVWLIQRLRAVGIRSINNIVDITNFVLMELGQPLHSFDYSFLEDKKIVVRLGRDGEVFTTLDEEDRRIDDEMLLICDGKRPVALAGIMGGENSQVLETTNDILLESAYFNPANIRRTSRKLTLSTDASIRFERGVDPHGVDFALHRAVALMAEIAGGKIAKGCLDENYYKEHKKTVMLRPERLNMVLGKEIPKDTVISALKGLELDVKDGNPLYVDIPSFRVDISCEEDLIEEVGRIYGYDNIEGSQFAAIPIQDQGGDNSSKYVDEIRTVFTGLGFYEALTYSIVGKRQNDWIDSEEGLIGLKNPLSEDTAYMRKTLIEGVLRVMEYNKNRQQQNVRIFEIGNVFSDEKGETPPEFESLRIAGALEGNCESPNWNNKKELIDIYYVKGILETFFNKINLDYYDFFYYDKQRLKECLGIKIDGIDSGFLGRVEDNYLDIPGKNGVYVFELSLNPIIDYLSNQKLLFKLISQFPSIERDLVFLVSKNVSAKEYIDCMGKYGGEHLRNIDIFDLYEGKQIPGDRKSLGFSLNFNSFERTLTESEIDAVLDSIIKEMAGKFGAKLRDK